MKNSRILSDYAPITRSLTAALAKEQEQVLNYSENLFIFKNKPNNEDKSVEDEEVESTNYSISFYWSLPS